MRVADLARHVAATIGRPDLLTIEPGPAENAFVCANVARLRNEVGWEPPADAAARLDETIQWWQSSEGAPRRG